VLVVGRGVRGRFERVGRQSRLLSVLELDGVGRVAEHRLGHLRDPTALAVVFAVLVLEYHLVVLVEAHTSNSTCQPKK
jgi:hypothetical protein